MELEDLELQFNSKSIFSWNQTLDLELKTPIPIPIACSSQPKAYLIAKEITRIEANKSETLSIEIDPPLIQMVQKTLAVQITIEVVCLDANKIVADNSYGVALYKTDENLF